MEMRSETTAATGLQTQTEMRLRGRTLVICRAIWITVALLELVLFLLNVLAPAVLQEICEECLWNDYVPSWSA